MIKPVNKLLIEPIYDSNYKPFYNDVVEISANDYYKIRSIGVNCYVVVKVNKQGVNDKFFKIVSLLSSEEDKTANPSRYYQESNIGDRSTFKYMIVTDGDLSYIENNSFSIYLTTGRSYDVDNTVIDIPTLQTNIIGDYPIEFKLSRDYSYSENIIEFNHDIFDSREVVFDDTLYCPKTPIIESYLYESYGNMIDIKDWSTYNHDNKSGKTAINSIMKSLQNSSNITDYCIALNSYYGLPIAPKNSKVIGLYESYAYVIESIFGNNLTLSLSDNTELHPFIQSGSMFFIEGRKEVFVDSVIDRLTGVIRINDSSELNVGDSINLKLKNKFIINEIITENEDDNAYVQFLQMKGR
jgi:hypothetical protein